MMLGRELINRAGSALHPIADERVQLVSCRGWAINGQENSGLRPDFNDRSYTKPTASLTSAMDEASPKRIEALFRSRAIFHLRQASGSHGQAKPSA